jgi:hypothetical protein
MAELFNSGIVGSDFWERTLCFQHEKVNKKPHWFLRASEVLVIKNPSAFIF